MEKPTWKQQAVICDLDGTLCLLNDRGPFEMGKCGDDLLNHPVARVLRTFHDAGHTIILVSGRFEQYRAQTVAWLNAQGLWWILEHASRPGELHLRADGDYRKDAEIKREIYEQHIAPHYDVWLSLDDRNQSVECWRALGVTCFQVAPGDF